MKPVVQSITMDVEPGMAQQAVEDGMPAGDCLRACIASIVELPAEEVPHFAQYRDGDRRLWWWALVGWCYSFGLDVICEAEPPALWSVAAGTSPRGIGHCCVAYNGKIVHDPHPDGGGLTQIDEWFAIIGIGAAKVLDADP